MNRNIHTQAGFTLIELLVVLAVAAILVAVGGPGLKQYIRNQQLSSRANAIAVTFNFARGEAISRNNSEGITITARNNPGGNPDWSYGWIVWEDNRNAQDCDNTEFDSDPAGGYADNDDARNAHGCEDLRENSYNRDGNITVSVTPDTLTNFRYLSSGLTDQQRSFEFKLCIPEYATGRIVSVSRTGRVSVKQTEKDKNECPI
jgi:type IV fimbrial biogenesis protein FimT